MTSDPIPDVNKPEILSNPRIPTANVENFFMQLASISYATQTLFLGNATLEETLVFVYRTVALPSFLEKHVGTQAHALEYSWGDVLKGIEEMSHNVTAALLTLSLGTMDANCSFYHQDLVYRYTPFALWVPYGVSNFSLLSCCDLTFSLLCFIDGLGHYSNFTCGCHHNNGKK